MKKIVLVALIVSPFFCVANQRQETFLKACAEFDAGHVAKALELYSSLEPQTPSILYNRASCYYLLGKYEKALTCARLVQKKGTREVAYKAQILIGEIQTKLSLKRDSAWYTVALLMQSYVSLVLVQLLFLFLLFFFVIALWRNALGPVRAVFLVSTLAFVGAFCGFDYWFCRQQYAVVIGNGVKVYAGPDAQFHVVGTVQAGQEVKVVEESQSWYKVSFQELQGWIQKTDLDKII